MKLSIIIPHYNSIDTLSKLIESIPVNDEIEIVVVDDGSDVSLEVILTTLSQSVKQIGDRNLKLISNDTGVKGPGGARNQGLSVAIGEWLLFADSDDSFVGTDGDWYEKFVKPYFASDVDLVYFSPIGVNADTGEPSSRQIRYEDLVKKCVAEDRLKNETELKYGFCTPWSKLFRASVAKDNGLEYGKTMVSEDVYFVTQFAYHARKIAADSNTIYCVTRSAGTLTSAKKERDYDTRVEVMIWRYNYLKERLTKQEFKYANMEWLAMAKLIDAIFDGWGMSKFRAVSRLYKDSGVKVFNAALFNPVNLFRNMMIELKFWAEVKKKR